MLKRTVTSLLWLFAVWTFGGMLSVFAGGYAMAWFVRRQWR